MAVQDPVVEVEVTAVAVEMPSLETRTEWYEDSEEANNDSRELARRDREYYDGKQWTDEEISRLKKRKQPIITKNRIARKINFILGEEIEKRIDPKAYPRTQMHEDAANTITQALLYVDDCQGFDVARSQVTKSALIEGVGGAIKGMADDGNGGYKHELRHIEYDRLFWDHHSRAPDFSDAKYMGIVVWMDLDDAVIEYQDAAQAIRDSINSNTPSRDLTDDVPRNSWIDRKRKRIKIVEMYFRIGDNWYRSDFTETVDLREPEPTFIQDENGKSSLCPLVLMSCYVDQDGARYGVVRQLISPQDEVNKRSSKSLHLLNVKGALVERNTVRDPEKFMAELAKPDPYIEVEPGALTGGAIQIIDGVALAQGQMALLQEAKADIDTIGPAASTMPELPSAASGIAFQSRQQAASKELGAIFDQLRSWSKQIFTLDWLCIRQYWTDEKWLRVTDDLEENKGYRFIALNQQMSRAQRLQNLLDNDKGADPQQAIMIAAGTYANIIMHDVQMMHQQMMQQAQATGDQQQQQAMADPQNMLQMIMQHPLMQEPVTVNQVDQLEIDIILDETPDTVTMAQQEFAALTELAPAITQGRPDLLPAFVKLLVQASSLPNKKALVDILDNQDPQQAQQAQMQQQMQQAQAQAGLAVTQSVAQLNQVKAQSEQARAQADIAKTQQSGAKVPSEIQRNEAAAIRDIAQANPQQQGNDQWQG